MIAQFTSIFAEAEAGGGPEFFTSTDAADSESAIFTAIGEPSEVESLADILDESLRDSGLLGKWFERSGSPLELLDHYRRLAEVEYAIELRDDAKVSQLELETSFPDGIFDTSDVVDLVVLLYGTLVCRADILLQRTPMVTIGYWGPEWTHKGLRLGKGFYPKQSLRFPVLLPEGDKILYQR